MAKADTTTAPEQPGQISLYFLQGELGAFTGIEQGRSLTDSFRESQELGSAGSPVTVKGAKCAGRVYPSRRWHELKLHSVMHTRCCQVKAQDIVGGEVMVEPLEGGTKASEMMLSDIRGVMKASVEGLVEACADFEAYGWGNLECIPTLSRGLYELLHIDAWTMWTRLDGEGYMHAREDHSKAIPFAPLGMWDKQNQVAWLNNNHWPHNTFHGVPDVYPVLIQIDTAWEALQHNRDFFQRRGGYRWMLLLEKKSVGGGQVAYAERAERAGAGDNVELIKSINYATKKVGKENEAEMLTIPIGNQSATLHRLDSDIKDLDFPALLATCDTAVRMAHGVPPIKLGISTAGALQGNVANQELRSYRDNVVLPKQRKWAQLIGRKIIPAFYGVPVEFQFSPLELDEFAMLAPKVSALFGASIISRDEARKFLGLDAVDGEEPKYGYDFAMAGGLGPDAIAAMQQLRGEA